MTEPFTSLWDLFEKSYAASSRTSLLFGTKLGGTWRWINYDEFRKDVERFRGALAKLGVGAGDRVAIVAPNCVEWAIAAYATYGQGASFVPMYEAQPSDEWEFILNDSGAKVVIGGSRTVYDHLVSLRDKAADARARARHLAVGHRRELVPVPCRARRIHAGRSGAAGLHRRRGISLHVRHDRESRRACCSRTRTFARTSSAVHGLFPFGGDERSLAFLPWAHAFGQTCELHTLVSQGCSMAINDDVARLIDNLAEVRPTLLYAVPRIFNRIYDGVQSAARDAARAGSEARSTRPLRAAGKKSHGETLGRRSIGALLAAADKLVFSKVRARFGGRLKWVISGSAALGREVAEFIDALGIEVYEGYGLTETSPIATTNYVGMRKIGTVGKAIPGVRIEIDTAVTGDAKVGEVVIHGPNVMRAYHNRPEETDAALTPDHGLRSGDLGFSDDDGFLFITGRIKEQYKLENGKYVAPAPLEERLKLSPYISNVMINGANKPYNVALVVLDRAAIQTSGQPSARHHRARSRP